MRSGPLIVALAALCGSAIAVAAIQVPPRDATQGNLRAIVQNWRLYTGKTIVVRGVIHASVTGTYLFTNDAEYARRRDMWRSDENDKGDGHAAIVAIRLATTNQMIARRELFEGARVKLIGRYYHMPDNYVCFDYCRWEGNVTQTSLIIESYAPRDALYRPWFEDQSPLTAARTDDPDFAPVRALAADFGRALRDGDRAKLLSLVEPNAVADVAYGFESSHSRYTWLFSQDYAQLPKGEIAFRAYATPGDIKNPAETYGAEYRDVEKEWLVCFRRDGAGNAPWPTYYGDGEFPSVSDPYMCRSLLRRAGRWWVS